MKTLRKIRKIINNLIDDIPAETRKLLPMAGILLLALVLIIIIVIAQSCGRREDEIPETTEYVFEDLIEETVSLLSETEAEPETEPEPDYGNLSKDSDPELLAVMKRYFTARANADLATINELYGITDESEAERSESQEVLEFNARYISSFDNITTYVMDGPSRNTWLVYTTADINFYTCSTKAPTIMWCFIEKDDDGEYHIIDSHALTTELSEYAEEENHTPEVRALAADVNDRLKEALESDPELEETYGVLRSGSPLWDNTSEAETEVAVIEEEPRQTERSEESSSSSSQETEAQEDNEEEADTVPAQTIEALNIDGASPVTDQSSAQAVAGTAVPDSTLVEVGGAPGGDSTAASDEISAAPLEAVPVE